MPKCYLNPKGSLSQYCKLMRYVAVPDPKTGQDSLEKHEAYLRRNSGFIIFYAAVMQSQRPGNPMGLDIAWKYIARLVSCSVLPGHTLQGLSPGGASIGIACFAPCLLHVPKTYPNVALSLRWTMQHMCKCCMIRSLLRHRTALLPCMTLLCIETPLGCQIN